MRRNRRAQVVAVPGVALALLFAVGSSDLGASQGTTQARVLAKGSSGNLPGLTVAKAKCTPKAGFSATGVTNSTVTVGSIISASAQLPLQTVSSQEGAQAYFNLVNKSGGICGRQIKYIEQNDMLSPTTHNYKTLVHEVFAFVADWSLLSQLDYQQDYPFLPVEQDNGEYVPVFGADDNNYGTSLSPYFVALGSRSTVLTTTVPAAYYVKAAKASAHGACRVWGLMAVRTTNAGSLSAIKSDEAALRALGQTTKIYQADLNDSVPAFQTIVSQMQSDGVNCTGSKMDSQSDQRFTLAATIQGVWPPNKCSGSKCFSVMVPAPPTGDSSYLRNVGAQGAGQLFLAFHIPFTDNQTKNPGLLFYLRALKGVPGAQPSAFSADGFAYAMLFTEALNACGSAPTRACVLNFTHRVKKFDAGGLIGPVTPWATMNVVCTTDNPCGNFKGKTGPNNTVTMKWPPMCIVITKLQVKRGKPDYYRVYPKSGFSCSATPFLASGTKAP
jgi:hypothetical protein